MSTYTGMPPEIPTPDICCGSSPFEKLPDKTKKTSDFLALDEQTLADLEIFESAKKQNLFQFCNFTNSKGGRNALRRRMERPAANPEHIREIQRSLEFIISTRDIFKQLPKNHVISSVERYRHAPLPIVHPQSPIEFTFGALSMWANNFNHFFSIWKGTSMTCTLIYMLRRFLEQPVLSRARGELVKLTDEMRSLLNSEALSRIPDQVYGKELWQIWQVLRLDQTFRINQTKTLSRLLSVLYEIEALIAMADCTSRHRFVFPNILSGPLEIAAEGLTHPFIPKPVANPVKLDQKHRGLFLTGPNMAGKTTYLRAFATAIYLAQLGMGVPARSFSFTPVERLMSSISLLDNLQDGVSYFQAEALRIKDVAQALVQGYRVIAIMDEPFKGTNVTDTLQASRATIERFLQRENFLFMFSSHQIELAKQLSGPIDYRYFSAIETEARLRFDYQIRSGVATQRIGMRVLREEGVFELLDRKPV